MTNYRLSSHFKLKPCYFGSMECNSNDKYTFIMSFDDDKKKSVLKYIHYVKTLIQKMEKILEFYSNKEWLYGKKLFEAKISNYGTESYKIRDEFNGKALNFNFRGTAYEINGYKAKVRNDITWSGQYNEALGINQLGSFNSTEVNWKEVPIICGEGQRLISSDNNLTIYCENKVALAMYEKSIIYDINGVETLGLS